MRDGDCGMGRRATIEEYHDNGPREGDEPSSEEAADNADDDPQEIVRESDEPEGPIHAP